VIDTRNNNNTLVTEIPVGGYPQGIAFDPDNGYLYVSNHINNLGNNTVLVIDTNRKASMME
jgi:DNA-binding beta-propeller fold protein YncE